MIEAEVTKVELSPRYSGVAKKPTFTLFSPHRPVIDT
jgi:hypothetical protein